MAIQTLTEIQAELADGQLRAVTAAKLRDAFNSVIAIAGTMYATNLPVNVTTSWAPFQFTDSIDTKGLTPQLADGSFLLETGAGGVYKVESTLVIDSANTGEIQMALVKNGALTPYVCTYSVIAGRKLATPLSGTGNLADGDTIGLAIKASDNATVTLVHGSFIATRL